MIPKLRGRDREADSDDDTGKPAAAGPDMRAKIIEELEVMLKKSRQGNEVFRVRAYDKVIKQLKIRDRPIITYDDLEGIEGIGSGIEQKIREILDTGVLQAAEEIKAEAEADADAGNRMKVYDDLIRVHGIGAVKAKNLIEKTAKITSIADLREKSLADPKLLNKQQKIGLKYYEEFIERIPRAEMRKHEKRIMDVITAAEPAAGAARAAMIVGSYRRGAKDSGDIDVLLPGDDTAAFHGIVEKMQESGYITDILALGDKKCMAVAQLGKTTRSKHRRLDILLTPADEFATSVLYFTGSDKFNIEMRRKAIELGYSLSEHGLKVKKPGIPEPPTFKTEQDIFDFLGMEYVAPTKR